MASAAPLYRIEGLTKVYGEGETAIAALRGPSGSGKSPFLDFAGAIAKRTKALLCDEPASEIDGGACCTDTGAG